MVLMTLINFNGTVGWVLLLLPLATLCVVVLFVVAGRERRLRAHHSTVGSLALISSGAHGEISKETALPESAISEKIAPQLQAPDAIPSGINAKSPERSQHDETAPWGTNSSRTNYSGKNDIVRVTAWLAQAEQRFDDGAVARHALELACLLVASGGSGREAQDHLRRAIILSTRLDDHATHAAARLELGDLLGADGDMTTACEHWQIARQIYWNGSDKKAVDDVDQRMIANGCPTDWVLTDF